MVGELTYYPKRKHQLLVSVRYQSCVSPKQRNYVHHIRQQVKILGCVNCVVLLMMNCSTHDLNKDNSRKLYAIPYLLKRPSELYQKYVNGNEAPSIEASPLKQKITSSMLDLAINLLKLNHGDAQHQSNLLFSPLSIYIGLAMLHLGAEGASRDELADVLGFPKEDDKIQQAHEAVSQILEAVQNSSVLVQLANAIFVQEGANLIPTYISLIQTHYKGEVSNLNFENDSNTVTNTINHYISSCTEGRISNLFSSPLEPDTRVLMATSLYFKASFQDPLMREMEVNFDTGSSIYSTEMMTQLRYVWYVKLEDLKIKAIRLSYASYDTTEFSIFFILPSKKQPVSSLISILDGTNVKRIIDSVRPQLVSVKIPKMKFKWSNNINSSLKKLGIEEIFSNDAQFNKLVDNSAIKLSQVTHVTEIEVNGFGTEAKETLSSLLKPFLRVFTPLSNVIGLQAAGFAQPYIESAVAFHINRPFLIFIYHHTTQAIPFMGVIRNPKSSSNFPQSDV